MAFGFPGVRGEEPPYAGFPSSGLVALYKCDERAGDKLADATGNYPAMTLATGAALDCAAANVLFADTTGLLASVAGQPGVVVMGGEIITPATAAADMHIISRNTSTEPALVLILEAVSGSFRISAGVRTARDGGAAALTTITSGTDFRLLVSTHYQFFVRLDLTDAAPHAIFGLRVGTTGAWRTIKVTGGTAGTHVITATGASRLLAYYNGTLPFIGKIMSAFAAAENIPVTTLMTVLDRFGKTAVRNTLGTTHARFWDFREGTGAKARELITDAFETISGTAAWSTSISGCTQIALRQGLPYYGRAGVALGGEDGYGAMGGGASSASHSQIVGSSDGWSVQATFRVGNNLPAAETVIASFYGPDTAGAIPAIASRPGVHFTLSATGTILCRLKRLAGTTDVGAGVNVTAGAGADEPENGLLTTFTAVCSAAGAVDVYRQHSGESTPTLAASFTTNTQNIATRADRAAVGQASMDGDVVVGFLATWSRPLTTAEMAQCHRNALARMTGSTLYVSGVSALFGNGTELYPYKDTTPAMRALQPNTTVNFAAGTYKRIGISPATLIPSSNENITIQGAGWASTIFAAENYGGSGPSLNAEGYPVKVDGGSWIFKDFNADADDTANAGITTGATILDSIYCQRIHVTDAKATPSAGTGIVTRATAVTVLGCKVSGCGEHGVYLRIEEETQGDHTFVIDDLHCYDNTEDGLKFAADSTTPNLSTRLVWRGYCNRLKVDGGLRQLWIEGVADSVFTNILLLNSTNTGGIPGALRLGHPSSGSTDADTEDGCWNNTIANITIVGAAGYAVYDTRSEGTTIRNLILSGNANDYAALSEGTAAITYAAGDDPDYPLPTHATNILGAAIAFTDAVGGDYTLTAGSDGTGDGVNLTGLSDEAEVMYDGVTARPTTGAWNMGAF